MSSEVPSGWSSVPLAKAGTWLSGGTPRRTNESYWGGHIPWISARSIHDFYLSDSEDRVTDDGAQSGTKLVPPGTVLMVVRGMSLANDFRVGVAQKPLTFNQDLKAILPDNELLDPLYLGLYLQGSENRVLGMVSTASHGTCKLDTGRLGALPVLLPPLPEQKKIAAILSSVDEAIQATQALIEQTRRVKEGLLQDLLTRGLPGHTRFKQTEIGEIPESWEVKSLGELSHRITKGTTPTTYGHSYTVSGVPFLRVENITADGTVDLADCKYVSVDTHEAFERSILKGGELLLSIAGAIGRAAVVPESVAPANINQALAVVRLRADRVSAEFMLHAVLSPVVGRQIDLLRAGLAQFNLNLKQVGGLKVPVPTLAVQRQIAARLGEFVAMLGSLEHYLRQLQKLKAGLLQDLLTGKVRVSV